MKKQKALKALLLHRLALLLLPLLLPLQKPAQKKLKQLDSRFGFIHTRFPMAIFISLVLFFLAVILHEYAHGWVAYQLGDPTAKHSGRLTLNPIAHIDPFGTIILPALLILTNAPILFGWAKPVPVNFLGLRNPKRDMIWVGLAGPGANILIAIITSWLAKLNIGFLPPALLVNFVVVNLFLAAFNLIPLPPLDGSRVVFGLLPNRLAYRYIQLERYGFALIICLVYLKIIDFFIWPIVKFFVRLLF